MWRNQTKVGLKVFQVLAGWKRPQNEEIRPRWDWKAHIDPMQMYHPLRRNQTKVGLKAYSPDGRRMLVAEEIRPRWDWKYKHCGCPRSTRLAEEIRPRWDWKSMHLGHQSQCHGRRNQTKVGLKVYIDAHGLGDVIQKKSDQGGIESRKDALDPRIADVRRNQTKVGLKAAPQSLCKKEQPRRNQTKVGLKVNTAIGEVKDGINKKKSDQGGIERLIGGIGLLLLLMEEIRPRWDWKFFTPFSLYFKKDRRNQTKVGLKEAWVGHVGFSCSEEIRPRWDWKCRER